MGYNMNGFSGFGNSPAKDNTGAHTKFKTETEHEGYHDVNPTENLNKAEMGKASKKKNTITKPKNKEEMDAFRTAQLETKGSDERETERINP